MHARIQAALDARCTSGVPVHYVHKGTDKRIDSYSGFACTNYVQFTELASILHRAREPISTVVVCGLATDYCVCHTAVDAAKFGFRTLVLEDCVRGVDASSTAHAYKVMQQYQVAVVPVCTSWKLYITWLYYKLCGGSKSQVAIMKLA